MDEGTARRLLKGRPRIDKTTDGLAAVARLCGLTDHDAAR